MQGEPQTQSGPLTKGNLPQDPDNNESSHAAARQKGVGNNRGMPKMHCRRTVTTAFACPSGARECGPARGPQCSRAICGSQAGGTSSLLFERCPPQEWAPFCKTPCSSKGACSNSRNLLACHGPSPAGCAEAAQRRQEPITRVRLDSKRDSCTGTKTLQESSVRLRLGA